MEAIGICSHLEHFRLISKIFAVSSEGISGEAHFSRGLPFARIEAVAQLAALHARRLLKFERHTFLLTVHHCLMPTLDLIAECFYISAKLRSQSSKAFAYNVVAHDRSGLEFSCDLMIGTQAYDDRFRKEVLKSHYQHLFTELMNWRDDV